MPRSMIRLTVSGAPHEFTYLWGRYVYGFDGDHHSQGCLRGQLSKHVRRTMPTSQVIVLDERTKPYDYVYLCAGASTGDADNIHLALVPCVGASVREEAHNGTLFLIENALRFEVPPLPEGFRGRGPEYTTCRNFQFGMSAYG